MATRREKFRTIAGKMEPATAGKPRRAFSDTAMRRLTADADAKTGTASDRDIEVISDSQQWFFGMDGDDMGHTVEDALIENDIAESQKFEKQIKGAFAEIEEWIVGIGGAVIFNGGDNVMFTATGNPKKIAEKARAIYKQHTDHTATVGVGREPVESHKSLVIGKNTGKDTVVIWSDDQESVYADIKKQQEALEKCEEKLREDSDFDLASSPALKYRAQQAQKHYGRLRGIGYRHTQALFFVNSLYKLSDSYRDILHRRKRPLMGDNPIAKYLRSGEEKWNSFVGNGFKQESSEQSVEIAAVPTVGQKVVTPDDLGRVAFVGSRFVSVEWLKSGRRERIALSKFREMESAQYVATLPQVRTARRKENALREGVRNG
jgi:hypothetical protein